MISENRVFDANLETMPQIMRFIEDLSAALPPKIAYEIMLVCEEVLINIVNYAYPAGGGQLTLLWENDTQGRELLIVFEDAGIPFNPLEKEEPKFDVPIAERKIGGLGIHMVRSLMDTANYERKDNKNFFTVTKKYVED